MDLTAGDSTASSLSDSRRDKEDSLRRRRERDSVRRASETGARRKERLRVRRERDRARRAAQSEEQRASVLLHKRKGLKKMAIVICVVIRRHAGWAVTNGRRTGGCLSHNAPPPPHYGQGFCPFRFPGQYSAELWPVSPPDCQVSPLPFNYSAGVVLSDSTYLRDMGSGS